MKKLLPLVLLLTACKPAENSTAPPIDIVATLNEKGFSVLGTIVVGLLAVGIIVGILYGSSYLTKKILDLDSVEHGFWVFLLILLVLALVGVVAYGLGLLLVMTIL